MSFLPSSLSLSLSLSLSFSSFKEDGDGGEEGGDGGEEGGSGGVGERSGDGGSGGSLHLASVIRCLISPVVLVEASPLICFFPSFCRNTHRRHMSITCCIHL